MAYPHTHDETTNLNEQTHFDYLISDAVQMGADQGKIVVLSFNDLK